VLPAPGEALLIVPEAEVSLAAEPVRFWTAFRRRFHDYAQRSTKVPEAPHRVAGTVKPGDRLRFGGVEVQVLGTPGFTAGAVSYLWSQGVPDAASAAGEWPGRYSGAGPCRRS
jgi:glyoxylase-like metal-dependent hydrolase (beta-lactamase superfamily II)